MQVDIRQNRRSTRFKTLLFTCLKPAFEKLCKYPLKVQFDYIII